MKSNILNILLIVFISCNAISAQTFTKNIVILNQKLVMDSIENYVNREINQWQMQGRYEKTEDYKKRVTATARDNKIAELTQKRTNEIANEVVNISIKSTEFDPDNEVYKIDLVGLPPIYIGIPIANQEASLFEANIDSLIFKNQIFILTNDGFALTEVVVYNPANSKSYQYNYENNLIFKQVKVEHTFEPVVIQTGNFTPSVTESDEIITLKNEINVDKDYPQTKMTQPNAIAIIIGNKDYQKISTVDFAIKDAKAIKNYLLTSLGYKPANILYYENIAKADFEELFGTAEFREARLFNMVKPNVSNVFIYYAGHGAPGMKNYKGYFVPVECDPDYLEFRGYSLETFYKNLAKLPAKSVTVVLDACFSGEDVHKDISAILPKVQDPVFMIPNGVLLASSSATQPSCWYNEQEHGLFTYFFLRAIKDKEISDANKDGKLTYGELHNYISSQTEGIPYYARRLHAKEQNPTIQGDKERVLIEY